MPKKNLVNYSYIYLYVIVFVIFGILALFVYSYMMNTLKHKVDNKEDHKTTKDKVCISLQEYDALKEKTKEPQQVPFNNPTRSPPRDYRVLNDQLYPPLNRTDTITHTMLENNINNRNMYVPTNDRNDNYRLIGYLVNKENDKDAGGNSWKLFAREKDRNQSDFYIIPSNNNYDIKIHINDDIIKGERLRDVYTVPKNITFNSPMLNAGPYEYVELPKADLTTSRYL